MKPAEQTQQQSGGQASEKVALMLHYRSVLKMCSASASQANHLFVAWLSALGAASSGLSDEHISVDRQKNNTQ